MYGIVTEIKSKNGSPMGHRTEPIGLVNTNVINKKGYYNCEIVGFSYKTRKNKPILVIYFRVFEGKYQDFKLSAGFYYRDVKGKVRLSHLCKAVGITGQLESPEDLLGKKLRLRIVIKDNEYQGRTYRNYLITRFHKLK